jgi:SAM-dependent methyltransferase
VSLAHAFPDAHVVALDRAPALLAMVRARADRNGLGDRVSTQVADLAVGLGVGGPFDVAWASMVLHHLADPERVLRELHAVLRPGGLVGLAEFGPPPRSLPEDLGFGEPGFEGRLVDAMRGTSEGHLPGDALGRDWTARLSRAGFEPCVQRAVALNLAAPLDGQTRRWIFQKFARAEHLVRDRLSATDRATLAILVDAGDSRSVMQRPDLMLDDGRTLHVARKAG